MTRFTISRAARAANVGVETIRFYERRGLIARPPKPLRGVREYDRSTVERIRFVRQAQEIGFSLREIGELLSLRADPAADCADVRVRATEKREEVQGKLRQLVRIRDALDRLIASCPGGGEVTACTILEALEQGADAVSDGVETKGPAKRKTETMKTTVLDIEGMHCDGCARTIEMLLYRVAGVRKAEASFDERRARVLHDAGAASGADLEAAVGKGGFKARAGQ